MFEDLFCLSTNWQCYTDMLFTLKLPSFDTILHNGKQQFVLSVLRSGNNLIDTVRVLI